MNESVSLTEVQRPRIGKMQSKPKFKKGEGEVNRQETPTIFLQEKKLKKIYIKSSEQFLEYVNLMRLKETKNEKEETNDSVIQIVTETALQAGERAKGNGGSNRESMRSRDGVQRYEGKNKKGHKSVGRTDKTYKTYKSEM